MLGISLNVIKTYIKYLIYQSILSLLFPLICAGTKQNIIQIWKGDVPLSNGKILSVEIQFFSNKDLLWIERTFDSKKEFFKQNHTSETITNGKFKRYFKQHKSDSCIFLLPKGPSCITSRKKGFLRTMYIVPFILKNLSPDEKKLVCQRYIREG